MGQARKYPIPHGPLPLDPVDDPAVDKTIGTGKSAGRSLHGKQSAAERHAQALTCRHPERIGNKTILVYDDIGTTGLQLNAVPQTDFFVDFGFRLACERRKRRIRETRIAHTQFLGPLQQRLNVVLQPSDGRQRVTRRRRPDVDPPMMI